MKICLINNLYGENARGGAETVVKTIAGGLKKKGHEVFVISLTMARGTLDSTVKGAPCHLCALKPLNLCRYEDLSKHGMFFRLIWHVFDVFNLHSFFAVRKILKKEKPDVVWTHNLMGLGFLTSLVIKSLKIKHIHTLHDVQLSAPSGLIIKGKEKPVFGQKFYEIICRILFGNPDTVISPSKWLMDFYAEKGFFPKSKKMVLLNPIQNLPSSGEEGVGGGADIKISAPLSPELNSGQLPSSEVSGNLINILFLGQIEDHKGIIFTINALKNLSLNFVLHIIGDGGKLEDIKNLVAGDARFIIYGRKIGTELEEIWKKINLAIVPSLCYENSPTVIFESFNRQIPVLASNIGGIPEIVAQEFLFEAGGEEGFMQKIKWFLENRESLKVKMPASALSTNDFIDTILREIKI
jgi:glycosyltransferase involved in cell wall biosynthesis